MITAATGEKAELAIHYLGLPVKQIRSGGDKYISEVLNYLSGHTDLRYWDFSDCVWSQMETHFRASWHAVATALKQNIWAIRQGWRLRRGDWILINSYYKQQSFLFVWFARYVRRCKLALMVNALYYRSRGSSFLNWLDRVLMWLFLKPAHVVIANSETTKNEIVRLHLPVGKVSVVCPRLDLPPPLTRPAPIKDETVFSLIFVGQCKPFKEVHLLIEAVGKLKHLPMHLHIVGDASPEGGYVALLKRLIDQWGLRDKVTFHGRQEGEDLTCRYHMADVLVSPGSGEGYGRVVIEAMHFGLPVIAAAAGASKELVNDGINGLLFKPGDSEDLARTIQILHNDAQLYRKMAKRAREDSELANFTEGVGKQIWEVMHAAT